MNLLIVESPAKVKTISKYLGKDFEVVASFGHVRDLPSKSGSVVPDQDFAMKYAVNEKSVKYVENIAKLAVKAENIYLATDPDREGESISWHILEILKEKKILNKKTKIKRISFNEISKKAILEAIEKPRDIDLNLVNAQQARRALDYLVGFVLSPLLWRKLPGCKSAGRVQSVALELVSEREDEIERFVSEEYWDITLGMSNIEKEAFTAKLISINGQKLEKFSITKEEEAQKIVRELEGKEFFVSKVEKKQQVRNPAPPFITSTMQQEASRKLGFSAKKTMQIAQKLYEGITINKETIGLITYMRTDSVVMSQNSIDETRNFILENFGDKYLPKKPRIFQTKAKQAQEAHEAIRPVNIFLTPENIRDQLDPDYYKLYELIWRRVVACQMENVLINTVAIYLDSKDKIFIAKANGSQIAFDGFYKIYREGEDKENTNKDNENTSKNDNKLLPRLEEGDDANLEDIKPAQHFTEASPRYSEATLVKKLEELGIGRPSTYAPILSVLQERNYVTLVKRKFIPTETGRILSVFLKQFFSKYVEYDFTANLENELDEIASGKKEWRDLLKDFWFGFNDNILSVDKFQIKDIIATIEDKLSFHLFNLSKNSNKCPNCNDAVLKLNLGKFGAYLGCSNYPGCNYRKSLNSLTNETNDNEISTSGEDNILTEQNNIDNNKLLGLDSKTGLNIYLKKGPYGFYLQLGEQSSKDDKPRRVPVPGNITPAKIDLDQAIKMLSLPLTIGAHPETKEEISANIGRYGPYIKYQAKYIRIPKNYDLFNISLEESLSLIKSNQSKQDKKK